MGVETVWKIVFFAAWLSMHHQASACSFAPTVCQQEFLEVVEEPVPVEPVPLVVKRETGELESFPVRDLYGQRCVCLEKSSNTYVCFDPSVEFDLPTEASFSEDQGTDECPVLCALDASSNEVCEPVCEFTELQLTPAYARVLQMSDDGSWGENRICTKPFQDSCCPERGTFCNFDDLQCVKPRCQNLMVDGCLQCQCATTRSFLSCPEPIDCTPHNAHICCIPPEVSGSKDYICDVWGKDTIVGNEWFVQEFYPKGSETPIFPGETKLSEECPADGEMLNTCEGVITSDEDCCPGSCEPKVPPPEPDCLALPDPGPCDAYFPSYFFNINTGRCDKFVYGGCGGNSNKFNTLEECQKACSICKFGPPLITQGNLHRCGVPGHPRRCRGGYFCNRKWNVCCRRQQL